MVDVEIHNAHKMKWIRLEPDDSRLDRFQKSYELLQTSDGQWSWREAREISPTAPPFSPVYSPPARPRTRLYPEVGPIGFESLCGPLSFTERPYPDTSYLAQSMLHPGQPASMLADPGSQQQYPPELSNTQLYQAPPPSHQPTMAPPVHHKVMFTPAPHRYQAYKPEDRMEVPQIRLVTPGGNIDNVPCSTRIEEEQPSRHWPLCMSDNTMNQGLRSESSALRPDYTQNQGLRSDYTQNQGLRPDSSHNPRGDYDEISIYSQPDKVKKQPEIARVTVHRDPTEEDYDPDYLT